MPVPGACVVKEGTQLCGSGSVHACTCMHACMHASASFGAPTRSLSADRLARCALDGTRTDSDSTARWSGCVCAGAFVRGSRAGGGTRPLPLFRAEAYVPVGERGAARVCLSWRFFRLLCVVVRLFLPPSFSAPFRRGCLAGWVAGLLLLCPFLVFLSLFVFSLRCCVFVWPAALLKESVQKRADTAVCVCVRAFFLKPFLALRPTMALVLMNELGAGALAAQTSVYNSAAYPAGDAASSTCDAALFAGDGNGFVLDRTHALGATGSQAAPFLVEFEPSSTLDHEAVLNGIAGVENVQTFSATTFQAYLPVDTAVFTTDFLNTNNVDAVTTLSNGVKVSAAVHALLGGSLTLAQASGSVSIIAETVGGTAPDLDDVVGHYELNGRTIPDCFGVTFDLGGIVVTGTNVTTTVSGTRATYSFPDTTEPQLIAYYLALLANEPEVLFAEPVAQAVTMASDASLSFPQGDAKEVAQGFGVTGACAYLHDRDFTGAGEVVAVIGASLILCCYFGGVSLTGQCMAVSLSPPST